MALTASVNLTASPIKLTVVSDKRKLTVSGTVTAAGETAPFTGAGTLPVKVTDADRTWTLLSDDGVTAVYTA